MLVEDGLRPTSELLARVRHVFAVRATHEIPVGIPDPPSEWADIYAALATDLELQAETIEPGIEQLRAFWALVRSTEEA